MESFIDLLLDRTLALLKVATYYYIDQIVESIRKKHDTNALLSRQASIALMK